MIKIQLIVFLPFNLWCFNYYDNSKNTIFTTYYFAIFNYLCIKKYITYWFSILYIFLLVRDSKHTSNLFSKTLRFTTFGLRNGFFKPKLITYAWWIWMVSQLVHLNKGTIFITVNSFYIWSLNNQIRNYFSLFISYSSPTNGHNSFLY